MAHGYYDKEGNWVPTGTYEEAIDAWRSERGYSTGGIYDMGGGKVVDTRDATRTATQTAADVVIPNIAEQGPIAPEVADFGWGIGGDFSGMSKSNDLYSGMEGFYGQGQDDPNFMGGKPVSADNIENFYARGKDDPNLMGGKLVTSYAPSQSVASKAYDIQSVQGMVRQAPLSQAQLTQLASGGLSQVGQASLHTGLSQTVEQGAALAGVTGPPSPDPDTYRTGGYDWENWSLRQQRDTLERNLISNGYTPAKAKQMADEWYINETGMGNVTGGPLEGGAYRTNTTLPVGADGTQSQTPAYSPSGTGPLGGGPPKGDSNEEISARIATRLVMDALNPLGPVSDPFSQSNTAPENLLMFTGESDDMMAGKTINPAMESVHKDVVSFLLYELMAAGLVNENLQLLRQPSDLDETRLLELFSLTSGAKTTEEFFRLIGYSPNLSFGGEGASGNVWAKSGRVNENTVNTAEVAASILTGPGYYYAGRNSNLFGGGKKGLASMRPPASNSWGQAAGGLYLWRISA